MSISDGREKPGVRCKGPRCQGLLHIPGGEQSTPSKWSRAPLPAPAWPSASPAGSAETIRLDGLPSWHVPRRPGGPGSFKRKMNVSYQQLEEIIQIGILFHYLLILVSQSPAFDSFLLRGFSEGCPVSLARLPRPNEHHHAAPGARGGDF